MNPWQGLNRFLLAIRESLAAMGRARIWVPFVVYLAVQCLLLVWLYYGVRPPWVDFLALLPDFVIPPEFFRYPLHFLLLPGVFFNRVLLPFGAFLEVLLLASATLMFAQYARREAIPTLAGAWRAVRSRYGQLIIFWILNYLLLLGYRELFDALLGDLWIGYGRRRMLVDALDVSGAVLVNAFLAYSTVIIVLEKTSFLATLRQTISAFGRHLIATFFIVLIGTLIVMPASKIMQQAPQWIGRFNPEVMLGVMGGAIVSGTIATFIMTAMLCFWYLLHRPAR